MGSDQSRDYPPSGYILQKYICQCMRLVITPYFLPLTPNTLPDSVKSRNCCHTSKDVDNRPCAPQNYYLWHWHMCFANETNYLQFYFDPQPHMRAGWKQRRRPPQTYSNMHSLLVRHIQSLYNRDATNIFYSRPNFPHPSLGCYPRLGLTSLPRDLIP